MTEPTLHSLATLRQLLAESPSWALWNSLIQMMDSWPEGEEKGVALDYLQAHLSASWPARWRQGSNHWYSSSLGWSLVERELHTLKSVPDATEVWIPPGDFLYGEENNHVTARVEEGFWMLTTSVTQEQWQQLMGSNPSYHTGNLKHPVEMVSWYDSLAFCNALSRAEGLEEAYILTNEQNTPGDGVGHGSVGQYRADVVWKGPQCKGYRLPSEIEWEWAARAGSTGDRYLPDVHSIAWCDKVEGDHTKPVAQKRPNAWGLYDMLGNVYDWCWDSLGHTIESPEKEVAFMPPVNPVPSGFVYRGGNFSSPESYCRAPYRSTASANDHYTGVGFRVCRKG